jgi:hypothetical protein
MTRNREEKGDRSMASRHRDRTAGRPAVGPGTALRPEPGSALPLGLTRRGLLRLAGGAVIVAGADALLPRSLFAAAACPVYVGNGKLLAMFSPPARWEDFPPGALRDELHRRWDLNVNQWTEQGILGNPWTSNLDSNHDFYFNPKVVPTPAPPTSTTKLVEWIAFPNRITTYLGSSWHDFTQDQLFELAENGRLADGTALPYIPQDVCPFIDSEPIPTKPYDPPGPRGWQDEYCEWAVERDGSGEIVRVMFTCENPEYWHTLWAVAPERVAELYRELVNPRVRLEDLYLVGADGKPVRDQNGSFVYNPLNRWNNSTRLLPGSGGAVHLTSPPNNLGAEIGLGAAATLLRYQDLDPQDLICCTPYGQPFRHSDPHIGFTINEAVGALAQRITIADPVGLYIQEPDFENLELPPEAVRAGLEPSDFWHLVRGEPCMGLHAVFRAPTGYERIKLSTIKVNGRPLRWGAQLTQLFQIGLRGTLIPAGDTPAQRDLLCPNDESPPPNRPAPYQLLAYDVARAFQALEPGRGGATGVSSTAAPEVRRGETLRDMALVTTGTTADTPIVFPAGGVNVRVKRFIANQAYHVPGNTGGGTFNIFVVDIEVTDQAPIGQLDLRLGSGFNAAGVAYLTVVEGQGRNS